MHAQVTWCYLLMMTGGTYEWWYWISFVERMRNKSTEKKIQDPPGIWTQELLNTSQDTLTIKTLDWTPGRGVEDNSAIYKTALG